MNTCVPAYAPKESLACRQARNPNEAHSHAHDTRAHTAMPKGCETPDMFHLAPCHLPLVPTYNWRIKITPGEKERTAGFLPSVCLRETRKNEEEKYEKQQKNLQERYWQGANYAEIG